MQQSMPIFSQAMDASQVQQQLQIAPQGMNQMSAATSQAIPQPAVVSQIPQQAQMGVQQGMMNQQVGAQQGMAQQFVSQPNVAQQVGYQQASNAQGATQSTPSAQTQQALLQQQMQAHALYQQQLYQQQLYQQQIQAQAQMYAQVMQAQAHQSQPGVNANQQQMIGLQTQCGNPLVDANQQAAVMGSQMNGLTRIGTVGRWFSDKSSGWINGDDGVNIFVHNSDIVGERNVLIEGERVTYQIGWNHKVSKQKAELVSPMNPDILEPENITPEPIQGTINRWDDGSSFGWIQCDMGTIFCHVSDCPSNQPLSAGTKVTFEIQMNHMSKKKKAVRVLVSSSGFGAMEEKKFQQVSVGPTVPTAHLTHGEKFAPY